MKGEARHLEEEKDKHILEVTFGKKKKTSFWGVTIFLEGSDF